MRRLVASAARRGTGPLLVVIVCLAGVLAALAGSSVDGRAAALAVGLAIGVAAASLVLPVAARATALARREGRMGGRQLLDELPSAILLFAGADVVYANRAAAGLFDLPTGDGAAPRSLTAAFADLGTKELSDAVEEALQLHRAIDVEIERGDRILAARATTLEPGEAVLVVRDVTRARRLSAVRRDFVINASHELKTPVAGIQALAESLALALRHDPPRAARMVTRMEHEAGRLARLVRDLLDLARVEEGGDRLERRGVDVVAVVRAQVDRLRTVAREHRVTIATDMPDVSQIVATPEDVRTIVSNLLENAVRYNRPGGTVRVSLRREDGGVVLEVADTGEGIAPAERDRVFERFYRIDKARSRAAGGTGLGLALVRHATQRLGGTITLDSEVGVGSTFRLVLPVARD